ncbi:hypothetical protein SMD22_00560 (plasmid) [Brevibacillus halotolerans]|nr:hypothetical protein SMD22_00560 [Brevibacillus halotolerans]
MVLEKLMEKMEKLRSKKETKLINFKRITNRRREIIELEKTNRENLEELNCIDHFFEAGGIKRYGEVASFCNANGFKRVIDIGCAYGFQSEIFLQEGIQYVGVTNHVSPFWNADKYEYIVDHYPCNLPIKHGDLAVSILCLTWNCYLYEGDKTLIEQCEALKRDFEHCILNAKPQILERYFKKIVKIGEDLYYFSNKEEPLVLEELPN